MSDRQEQLQGDEGPKAHVWYFRLRRDARPQQVEFGNALNKTDASNRIAAQLGMDSLPSEAVVSHVPLKKLAGKEQESEAQPLQEESTPADESDTAKDAG